MLRERLLIAAVDTLGFSGITHLLRPFYGGRGAILALHRVVPDDFQTLIPGQAVTVSQLRDTLQFVKSRGMDLISLAEIPSRIKSRSSRRFVAITLDDGYRDNLDHGLPVFREFGAPFAVFPCTGFLDRTHIPWAYTLESLCLGADRIIWRQPESEPVEFVRSQGEDKLAFFCRVESTIGRAAGPNQCADVALMGEGLSTAEVNDQIYLSWDQLKLLASDPLATIGVHTVTHAWLASKSEKEAEWEIGSAREELERRLGSPVRHIAYPFGSPGACGPREFQLAKNMGFLTGLTTKRGNLQEDQKDLLWSLPRHTLSMTPHSISTRYLRISLDGVWDTPLNGTLFTR